MKGGNRFLARAVEHPLPIFFFYKSPSDDRWEYQGVVDVVGYRRVYYDREERYVFEFTLQRHAELTERVDTDESVPDLSQPERVETTRSRVVRNTALFHELKQLYGHECQVCGGRRRNAPEVGYAEGHHLRPLGRPHDGPDSRANVLVLCPNHHADFDYGMISVDPESKTVAHAYEQHLSGSTLTVAEDHPLEDEYLAYHNREIAEF